VKILDESAAGEAKNRETEKSNKEAANITK
jgi:hypothetical protein